MFDEKYKQLKDICIKYPDRIPIAELAGWLGCSISIHAPAWGATATTDSIFRYVDDIIRYCEQCAAAVAY